ncbi:MAG: hypothetical protein ABSC92_12275 [Rhizomicrobium sp.]|jgi:hypothetical protein
MAERDEFGELELLLAEAGPHDQLELSNAAARLLMYDPMDRARLSSFHRAGAFADGAMLVYCAALPDYGFQFGLGPRRSGSPRRATALTWQRDDACAMPYSATTPALALLRAAVHDTARMHDAHTLAACPLCRGLGWYVTAENRKQMCRHGAR